DMGLALIFMTLRGMIEADRYVREGRWPEGGPFTLGRTPRGKRLGILGLGRIGMELARRAETIGMKVSYHNRTEKPVNYPYVADLVELARQSDVLALCCPGGPATHNLVDARVLDALGPQGWLINIARGSVVDEPALIAALEGKAIAGAGIDVFADEPRVPEALRQMRNVVLQPHMASATVETRDAMAQLVVDNLEAHFAGKPVLTRVG
ncbi:MAG: 2-hydroxyacid dehydrogenase, partial [Geminicoccaceae bacterium]|nr:2-hydroxyacid dehydrogenase [Geminicoccaceae bacterium]